MRCWREPLGRVWAESQGAVQTRSPSLKAVTLGARHSLKQQNSRLFRGKGNAHDVEVVDYHRRRKVFMSGKKGSPVWGWNVHPGEILHEEFLKPLNISVNELAKQIHLSRLCSPKIGAIGCVRVFVGKSKHILHVRA